jgi:hypothetical protein
VTDGSGGTDGDEGSSTDGPTSGQDDDSTATDDEGPDVRFDLPPVRLDLPPEENPATKCGIPEWAEDCAPTSTESGEYLDEVCVPLPEGRTGCDECEPDCIAEHPYDCVPTSCMVLDRRGIIELPCGPLPTDDGSCCYLARYLYDEYACVCLGGASLPGAPEAVFDDQSETSELLDRSEVEASSLPSKARIVDRILQSDILPADVVARLRALGE